MAYTESLQAKYDWEDALSLAEERAAEKAAAKARLEEREKAEADKLETAHSLKKIGVLTNKQIAESLNLPLAVVEQL